MTPLPPASKRQEGGGEAAGEVRRESLPTGRSDHGAPAWALEAVEEAGSVASRSCAGMHARVRVARP